MSSFGKTIKIYLADGNVTGIKIGEIVNNTIQAIYCSRFRLSELISFPQTKKPGVYLLLGQDDQSNIPKAYIGEAENTYNRLLTHITGKDFWNDVIFFVSKDENLTKSHVKYLESRLVQLAKAANRYKIENSNNSHASSLPLPDRDAMEEFLSHIKILLGVFNHLILEDPPGVTSSSNSTEMLALPEYENKGRNLSVFVSGLRAEAIQTDEGIIVLKGSQAAEKETDALQTGYKAIRNMLINEGTLEFSDNKYVFRDNTLFKSPSAAAAVIVGYNINGLQFWRDFSGKTLSEIEKLKT